MLSCRTEGTNIEAFSLHPGSIATNLSRHMGVVGSVMNFGLSWFSKTTEQVLLILARMMLAHIAVVLHGTMQLGRTAVSSGHSYPHLR